MIRWVAPGPYEVAFTTREGGVSEGAFESLNLGIAGDDPARVVENRRRACEALELDPARLAVNRQCHSARVNRAVAGGRGEPGDGLWTDEAGLPLLALAADCVPIAVVATGGRSVVAVVHAGWRGLAGGVVEATVAALAATESAAIVGPSVGPCCYEVGLEVSERFDSDLTSGRILDLWEAAERALVRAGVDRVERLDLCTRCNPELFFSHRRTGRPHGVQGVIGALRS